MKKGFTFIEILFTVTIVTIISALSMAKYNDFTERKRLEGEARQLIDTLELAKKKSIVSDLYSTCANFKGYSVQVNTTSYTLIFLCNSSSLNIKSYSFSQGNAIASGTEGTITFNPIDGTIAQTHTFTISNSLINKSVDISISRTGVIEMGPIY